MSEAARPGSGPGPALVGAGFLGGVALGGLLIAPALPPALAALPSLLTLGPVGEALVAGALGIVVIVAGLAALYFLFLVAER
jgi:hypothetical protein